MKKLIFSLFLATCLISACDKEIETDPFSTAIINGYDLRLCACCGGLLISLDSTNNDVYQWYQKNGDFGVTYLDTFPMQVKIRYHHVNNTCFASKGEIEINELKKIK